MGCEERLLQVITLHTLIIWGAARVPLRSSTINTLKASGERHEEETERETEQAPMWNINYLTVYVWAGGSTKVWPNAHI